VDEGRGADPGPRPFAVHLTAPDVFRHVRTQCHSEEDAPANLPIHQSLRADRRIGWMGALPRRSRRLRARSRPLDGPHRRRTRFFSRRAGVGAGERIAWAPPFRMTVILRARGFRVGHDGSARGVTRSTGRTVAAPDSSVGAQASVRGRGSRGRLLQNDSDPPRAGFPVGHDGSARGTIRSTSRTVAEPDSSVGARTSVRGRGSRGRLLQNDSDPPRAEFPRRPRRFRARSHPLDGPHRRRTRFFSRRADVRGGRGSRGRLPQNDSDPPRAGFPCRSRRLRARSHPLDVPHRRRTRFFSRRADVGAGERIARAPPSE
jgi:hypothetical protein